MIEVIKPGMLTTVQDLGRIGFQQYGMVVSGAMDSFAFQVGNVLVGNEMNEVGLEITMIGPVLRTQCDRIICITGANLQPMIENRPIPMWQSVVWRRGEILHFAGGIEGARAYIAVAGGLDLPEVMESRSTYLTGKLGGYQGRALQSGDRLKGKDINRPPLQVIGSKLSSRLIPAYSREPVIRVILGPHQDYFTSEGIEMFLSSKYQVTPLSNRMGIRLHGEPIIHTDRADIFSCAVTFGTIQVPADGQPIILMADRQTTGGYTQIAIVISVDLPLVAQLLPGNQLSFQAIYVEEAQQLYIKQQKELKQLELLQRYRR